MQNKLSKLHIKKLEKEEQIKPKVCRRKDLIKIRVEISDLETKMTTEKTNKTQSCFFERINKTDKLSQTYQEKKREGSNK